MADKENKVAGNVDGKYYVDDECSACCLCPDTAPENIKMNDDDSFAVVFKQPGNEDEENACKEALEECPSEAIGDDG